MKALVEIATRNLIAFYSDKARITLPTGETVLGMAPGWSNGTYECLAVEDTNPDYDARTQIKSGPVVTVEADRVTRVWTVTDKTAQQIADEIDAQRDAEVVDWFTDPERAGYQQLAAFIRDFNRHTEKIIELATAIVQGSSLADIKSRIQAIEPIPTRTFEDLVTDIRNHMGEE